MIQLKVRLDVPAKTWFNNSTEEPAKDEVIVIDKTVLEIVVSCVSRNSGIFIGKKKIIEYLMGSYTNEHCK